MGPCLGPADGDVQPEYVLEATLGKPELRREEQQNWSAQGTSTTGSKNKILKTFPCDVPNSQTHQSQQKVQNYCSRSWE